MSSTPSSRLRLTPSNSPFLPRPGRSSHRGRHSLESRLSLKRVIGTTCASPTGFDAAESSFAYIAGGAVVVVDVEGEIHNQRFFRARPNAIPTLSPGNPTYSPSTSTSTTPKANDSRNRVSIPARDSSYGVGDWSESPSSKTWTSRERIKAATSLALSRDGRFLAVGETGYAPRVLIYSLEDTSSDTPLVSISEHMYGVKAVAWSPDTKFLASLGAANDGFLYLWRIDPRTGAAKLFQQNRCTSYIRGMIWMGNSLITLGVRHVKLWRVEEFAPSSPLKQRFTGEMSSPSGPQKSLPGRNILLGGLLEATFSCAVAIDETRAIVCSETGDICLLDDTGKQMKLTKVLEIGFMTACITIREQVVYVGGKPGSFCTLDLKMFMECNPDCVLKTSESPSGLLALGFLKNNLVTVDAQHSIDIWSTTYIPGRKDTTISRIQIPGHGDAILGVEVLCQPSNADAAFFTWTGSGNIVLWDVDGRIRDSFNVELEDAYFENESDPVNQLTVVKATRGGKFFVTGDRLGVMKVIEYGSKDCVSETKAHSSNCQSIATYEDNSKFLIASCGRDRTAQLFHRTSDGSFEHFQTLEFAAKVVQVLIPSSDRVITCSMDRTLQIHDMVTKDGEPDSIAAIPARSLTLKASPASMAMVTGGRSIFVSLLDRSVCLYDTETGRLTNTFKCTDEVGVENVVLDSLITRPPTDKEPALLLGISNTDKSIRLYDAQNGNFLDREWGHTEAINGVALIEDAEGPKKVVSAGSDGTIMIWGLDSQEQAPSSRDPSPMKDNFTSARPPLRRVLSKAELAEFQRPSRSAGRRSPPRPVSKRRSLFNLSSARSSVTAIPSSPASVIAEDTPSRRPSGGSRSGSPPVSPRTRVARRPSMPILKLPKTKSTSNLRAFGSLNMATEQACRTLKAYRKKLSSTEPISQDVLAELDQELRLTSLALGDRAKQSRELSDSMLNGILDQYSSRLMAMLDEKLRLGNQSSARGESYSPPGKRPNSSGSGSTRESI
ncbi:WD repeat-containing protein [Pseudomassariella vexata]|uniref:WD repeat-containing protein n=1 Tax=Pseudomassariella vexata TaxID=1141098 RepID=A0A1Y2DA37_9PEZI|nr:WD repeat-containing protein [Pseudomassariella vexata]ORY56119.1 WD repeat-containing protein [Pseudomassariella vexata]